jgi:hypothetical protein
MDDLKKKILALLLQGYQAQMNAGILAINVQAAKGRVPNWQAQNFMSNTGQNLMQFGVSAPQLLTGGIQPQGNDMLTQMTALLKDSKSDDKVGRLDKKVYHMGNDIKSIAESVGKLVDAAK